MNRDEEASGKKITLSGKGLAKLLAQITAISYVLQHCATEDISVIDLIVILMLLLFVFWPGFQGNRIDTNAKGLTKLLIIIAMGCYVLYYLYLCATEGAFAIYLIALTALFLSMFWPELLDWCFGRKDN